MRLQIVQDPTGYPFEFSCIQCRTRQTSTRGYVADLDGEAFKAYYCLQCGSAKLILHDRTKGAVQS